MKYFSPDTNFFLQCKDYLTLDWSLLSGDEEIRLVVPRTVLRELDKHKSGGNTRRASRARKISSMIDEVLEADGCRMTKAQARGKTITIELLFPPALVADLYPQLDLSNPDDRIIAEIQWFSNEHPENEVVFITDDSAAKQTARAVGILYAKLPAEWMLAPEPDQRDKAIAEMRQRIAALESEAPVLHFEHANETSGPPIFEFTFFEPLDEASILRLIELAKSSYPMQTDFSGKPSMEGWPAHLRGTEAIGFAYAAIGTLPPSDADIQRYQEIDYPKWLSALERHLETVHDDFNDLLASVTISMLNDGSRPANNLLVEFSIDGSAVFISPEAEKSEPTPRAIASPPSPPKRKPIVSSVMAEWAMTRQIPAMDFTAYKLPEMHRIKERDPNCFYPKDGSTAASTSTLAFECSSFRHKHAPEQFSLSIRPTKFDASEAGAVIRCTAHAENAAQVVELVVPVRFRILLGDTFERARKLVRRIPLEL
ncbi:hypothetical protein AWB69_03883 [Caballeronia udeis]|uniref:PIN domain-containing protein n=1 Tax=Caballeronia udeis TaxID=1232866 RepID=A0A158H5F8_9BURK|nr:PIN domain-containing protein [Caballeronia udeis]SAL39293.1 hypothetical protein AWB69_03883 [Caballeronia udeis]